VKAYKKSKAIQLMQFEMSNSALSSRGRRQTPGTKGRGVKKAISQISQSPTGDRVLLRAAALFEKHQSILVFHSNLVSVCWKLLWESFKSGSALNLEQSLKINHSKYFEMN